VTERGALYDGMRDASPEWGMMPFWFWNDGLDEAELKRQLRELRGGGFGGVVIHPRVGLSREVGYLTERYFALVRSAVAECAALEMKVILYDEGSYPSGSGRGRRPRAVRRRSSAAHEAARIRGGGATCAGAAQARGTALRRERS
jgi:hypothetical protein